MAILAGYLEDGIQIPRADEVVAVRVLVHTVDVEIIEGANITAPVVFSWYGVFGIRPSVIERMPFKVEVILLEIHLAEDGVLCPSDAIKDIETCQVVLSGQILGENGLCAVVDQIELMQIGSSWKLDYPSYLVAIVQNDAPPMTIFSCLNPLKEAQVLADASLIVTDIQAEACGTQSVSSPTPNELLNNPVSFFQLCSDVSMTYPL